MACAIRPSNVRVYQFHHFRKLEKIDEGLLILALGRRLRRARRRRRAHGRPERLRVCRRRTHGGLLSLSES